MTARPTGLGSHDLLTADELALYLGCARDKAVTWAAGVPPSAKRWPLHSSPSVVFSNVATQPRCIAEHPTVVASRPVPCYRFCGRPAHPTSEFGCGWTLRLAPETP